MPHDEPDGAATSPSALSAEQNTALFDILTHYETYREIAGFRSADAVTGYGFPFEDAAGLCDECVGEEEEEEDDEEEAEEEEEEAEEEQQEEHKEQKQQNHQHHNHHHHPSTSPLLHLLLTKLLLPLPGLNHLPRPFWTTRLHTLLTRLAHADLSDSYDKGALGTRKVLATGAAALLEMLARGLLGGWVDGEEKHADGDERGDGHADTGTANAQYDLSRADDLERAWQNVLQGLVYGDLGDRVFGHFVGSDDLEAMGGMVEASIFVLSPEGQYLLKLMENVHSLIPYKLIRQTLRIGNAATMISGMMRILLAKLSVTSVTNWFGLTQNADDGMNLVQRIISLVLSWDANEFKKSADKIERAKADDAPTEEMLRLIREYIEESKSHHDMVRSASQQNEQSIVTEIFNASNPHVNTQLTEAQHAQCLEYYSSLLSVRDRDRITDVFCRQPPDMFTQALKDIVAAYSPMIRAIHANIDLRDHFDALQGFVEDFIKTSRPKERKGSTTYASRGGKEEEEEQQQEENRALPSVEDYVALLMRHRRSVYKWVHVLARQCPDIWESFRIWANQTLVQFQKKKKKKKKKSKKKKKTTKDSCASMSSILNALYAALDPDTQTEVRAAIDRHATYLSTLSLVSQARLQYLVTASDSAGGSTAGPGVYLSRWQSLLDETPITPLQRKGPVRRGKDVKHTATMGKTGTGGSKVVNVREEGQTEAVEAPDVTVVVDALGEAFRREVGVWEARVWEAGIREARV
ncbi:hypothetical protein E4U55_004533 [Claviceps digitariae]|nr:hypothetical protein E4U55_004533 [Claviceps digitariae]